MPPSARNRACEPSRAFDRLLCALASHRPRPNVENMDARAASRFRLRAALIGQPATSCPLQLRNDTTNIPKAILQDEVNDRDKKKVRRAARGARATRRGVVGEAVCVFV